MTDPTVVVPPNLVPRLKQLWNAGLTALECAEELGIVGDPNQVRQAIIRAHQTPAPAVVKVAKPPEFWTDEKVDQLRKRHEQGLLSFEIAEIIGTSRRAVLGKIKRLGLANNKTISLRKQRSYRASVQVAVDPMFANDGVDGAPAPEDLEIPVERRRSLLGGATDVYPERGPRECAWPVGDPKDAAFFFCGDERFNDEPYCRHHCRVAYGARMSRKRAA